MVDSVQPRAEARPSAAALPSAPDATAVAPGFGAALAQAIDGAALAAAPEQFALALQLPALPPRMNPQVALHCLAVNARPQPSLRYASYRFSQQPTPATGIAGFGHPSPPRPASAATAPTGATGATASCGPLSLSAYPRPTGDNGRGVHWIPTTSQSPEVVDRFTERLKALNVRWVTFLNRPDDLSGNEYLVQKLNQAGIMPVMRIYSEGTQPMQEDLTGLVQHYRSLGVSYFQLYNEPNLKDENAGGAPDAARYANAWISAARQVVAAGGLPGLAPLSPQGDANDLAFLRSALEAIKVQGGAGLLQRSWLSVHNYGQDHLRVRQYDQVVRDVTGRSLPQIGTEAGIYPDGNITEADQVRIVSNAYNYLERREPYYFAYSLWCLANQAGGGHDGRWEGQALYRADGPSALARALEQDLTSRA